MVHPFGLDGTHLLRHHADGSQFLSAYGVFHGDDRHPAGDPLPTGSLRRSTAAQLGGSSRGPYHSMTTGPPPSYVIQPTMSLRSLSQKASSPHAKTLPSNRSLGLATTTFQYQTGSYTSTSGGGAKHMGASGQEGGSK